MGGHLFANGSEDLTLKTQPIRSKIFGNDPTSILILDLLMMLQFDTVNEEDLKNILILVFARMETDAYFYLYVCGKRRR